MIFKHNSKHVSICFTFYVKVNFPCSLRIRPWLQFTGDLNPNDDIACNDSVYNCGNRETTDSRQAAHLRGRCGGALTARVKCQHYHRFLIGCFVSFPFVTFAQNEQLFPTVHCQFQNIKSCFCVIIFFLMVLSFELKLICSQLASEAEGANAFGVISSVAAHASLGCKDNIAQPRLKASTPSWRSDAAHRSHSATDGFEATTEKSTTLVTVWPACVGLVWVCEPAVRNF